MWRRAFIAALGGAAAMPLTVGAQEAVKIERIEVARPGVYEIQAKQSMQDQSISTGHRMSVRGYKNVRTGTQINAMIGTVIGAELTIVGTPKHAKVPIKVVWRYPAPGLVNPQTKAVRTMDEYTDVQQVSDKFPVFWSLAQDWHLVAGTWILEVWQADQKFVEQQFQLAK